MPGDKKRLMQLVALYYKDALDKGISETEINTSLRNVSNLADIIRLRNQNEVHTNERDGKTKRAT